VEEILARIAGASHGVVTRRQLICAGITGEEIKQRLRRGTLRPQYRGVYRVGHRAPSMEAHYLAAVRAGGDGALLRGRAAGHLLGLLRGPPPPPDVLTRWTRRIPGVRAYRSDYIDPRDATTCRRIPVTTVPRTLVDLAACLDEDDLARAYHQADVRYRTSPAHVEEVLRRRPRSPGAGTLRRVLYGDVHLTLSRMEKRFLARLREARRPLPQTNGAVGAHYVDCRWPEHRLTVELDSYRYHRSRHAWEEDRRREREAYARGDQFRRYTWSDVFERPTPMMAELAVLLA
jgi:hypothetical protein